MIKELLPDFFVNEKASDGGVESIVTIIKHYKRNALMVNFSDLIMKIYVKYNSFESLRLIANKFGLIAVTCDEIDLPTIVEYNQPIIINISSSKKQCHFVVCYGFNEQNEFEIYDHKKGFYKSSIAVMSSLWNDNVCMAFVNV